MARRKVKQDELTEKTRLQLRIDTDLANRLEKLADDVGVSTNQLLQGVMRWAVENAHPGEISKFGTVIETRPRPGCVWFGRNAPTSEDDESSVAFELDFTERRVVREPTPRAKGK